MQRNDGEYEGALYRPCCGMAPAPEASDVDEAAAPPSLLWPPGSDLTPINTAA